MNEKKITAAILEVIKSFRNVDINREQREAFIELAVELDISTIVEEVLKEGPDNKRH